MRDDDVITRALGYDFSAGTEAFRDELLGRCLAELDADAPRELKDGELDLLAAAGDVYLQQLDGFGDNR